MNTLSISLSSSALVLIDLQEGIVARAAAPRNGSEVVKNAARLAARFRETHATVVLVRVAFSPDLKDFLVLDADSPMQVSGTRPANWSDIVPEIGPQPGDLLVTKRQWGAFYGTDLDLQLRRRGVEKIVLAGIATNFGVESTARGAYERGYQQVFVEDAMTSLTTEGHDFVIKSIFPRIGRIRSTSAVLEALSS